MSIILDHVSTRFFPCIKHIFIYSSLRICVRRFEHQRLFFSFSHKQRSLEKEKTASRKKKNRYRVSSIFPHSTRSLYFLSRNFLSFSVRSFPRSFVHAINQKQDKTIFEIKRYKAVHKLRFSWTFFVNYSTSFPTKDRLFR